MSAPKIEHRVRFSGRARVIHTAARWGVRPVLSLWPLTPAALRVVPALELAAALRKAPAGTRTERLRIAGFLAEWVKADGVAPGLPDPSAGAVLYFHGGGFISCGLGTHRRCVSTLSRTSRKPVLSVAYRQYPVTHLDGSVRDGVFAYRWLLGHGYPADKIVVAGDSAGGYLAFRVALTALAEGLPVPAGILGISPLLDWDATERSTHVNVRRDAYIPAERVPKLYRLVAPLAGPVDPMLSPINHELRGLPPVLMQVAGSEILRCDAERMAARLAEADVPCTLQIWSGQVHAFPVLAGLLPEAMAALIEAGSFIQSVTSQPAGRRAGVEPATRDRPKRNRAKLDHRGREQARFHPPAIGETA
jgi:acetyl esterase/lipase